MFNFFYQKVQWESSIDAALNHLREYDDPMILADPFVCVGVVSLIERSGGSIMRYKSWCRYVVLFNLCFFFGVFDVFDVF